jgi:hypothetical protein
MISSIMKSSQTTGCCSGPLVSIRDRFVMWGGIDEGLQSWKMSERFEADERDVLESVRAWLDILRGP